MKNHPVWSRLCPVSGLHSKDIIFLGLNQLNSNPGSTVPPCAESYEQSRVGASSFIEAVLCWSFYTFAKWQVEVTVVSLIKER